MPINLVNAVPAFRCVFSILLGTFLFSSFYYLFLLSGKCLLFLYNINIREYRYAFGAVEPFTGDSCFLVLPYCNTVCMNLFLQELSEQFPDDIVLLCCDGAAWHKSRTLELPENIVLFHIPPNTPEMNPIEQIWQEIRKRGFCNEVFTSLMKVVDRLCDTISSLPAQLISHITCRNWIAKVF